MFFRGEKLISNGVLKGLESSILANIFTVKSKRNEPLELKVDNVFFLGSSQYINSNGVQYNIVFAVKSPLPKPVIACYQRLSLDIVNALIKEEVNHNYIANQSKYLIDEEQTNDQTFARALQKCQLAQEFRQIYEQIKNEGIVHLKLNGHLLISFCLPHLAYKIKEKCEQTHFVNVILNADEYLQSYHGVLLLIPKETLMKLLPADCNNLLKQLLDIYNPRYSLTHYAAELDSSAEQIKSIVVHLIQWAKVKVIYPIAETSVYVINPYSNTHIFINSSLSQSFSDKFPEYSLPMILEKFSTSQMLIQHMDPTTPKEKHLRVFEMVIWLLERNLILQTHTYIFLLVKKAMVINDISSTKSDTSIETNYDQDLSGGAGTIGGGGGSEHSNETDNTDHKDALLFDKYRRLLSDNGVNEKDQQYVLRLLHHKADTERRQFFRYLRYFNGTWNIDEIIYEEKTTRSDIYMLLEAFKDILTLAVCEDPNPLLRINVKVE